MKFRIVASALMAACSVLALASSQAQAFELLDRVLGGGHGHGGGCCAPELLCADLLCADLLCADLLCPQVLCADLLCPQVLRSGLCGSELLRSQVLRSGLLRSQVLRSDLLRSFAWLRRLWRPRPSIPLLPEEPLQPSLLRRSLELLRSELLRPQVLRSDLLCPDLLRSGLRPLNS